MVKYFYGIAILIALLAAVASMSYSRGLQAGKNEQAQRNLVAYQEIVEAISNETLDVTDDNAVLSELCRLAGVTESDDICTVSGD